MGIYDREYYRGEGSGFLGAIMGQGKVTLWLIIINALVFLLQFGWVDQNGRSPVTEYLQLSVPAIAHGQVWRLLTYAFLHASILHIVFNMWFLWMFGNELETMYSAKEFLGFYLIAAVFGGLVFLVAEYLTGIPGRVFPTVIGASGAVTAVIILYAIHFPYRPIYLFFLLPVPMWALAVFEVAVDSFVFLGGVQTTTAVAVHLGGAAFGFLYYKTGLRITNLVPDIRGWRDRLTRPRLRIYREERPRVAAPAPSKPSAAARDVDEHLEAQVDAVLEKVARYGQNSLTEHERQLLLRASEVYRKKRT
ncbi:MAG TPA: rhomboid family intramembrane serine protease [Gemmataceae bacterium]|nr:rhomboid family intramembrane serine protease [Gemmataceae bacterium]